MGSAAKAQEPTMEEILASIRRIIADDDASLAIADDVSETAKGESVVKAAVGSEMNQEDIDAMLADFDPPAASAPKLKAVKTKVEPAKQPDLEDDDILELTTSSQIKEPEKVALDVMDDEFEEPVPASPAKALRESIPTTPLNDVVFRDADDVIHPKVESVPEIKASAASHALLSEQTNAAVANAFGSLTNTIFAQKPRTMDELVQEMLRPMLKNWLDENLPEVVENLVKAEIERIARGR